MFVCIYTYFEREREIEIEGERENILSLQNRKDDV